MEQTLQVLQDKSATGRIRPWREFKMANEYLSSAYDEVDPKKAERLRGCASLLTYVPTPEGMKLVNANFCRVRLCPICQWRKALKTYSQMSAIMKVIETEYNYKFIFITLTAENCKGEDLNQRITDMMLSFNRLTMYKDVQAMNDGYYRGFEVTHNLKNDTYHPHFHILMAVKPSYFKSRYYVSQEKWTSLWRKAMQVEYNPIVDIRKVKGNTAKAVSEIAKYAIKPSDILNFDDWDLTVQTVALLDRALDKRRFVAYGGIFKEIHRRLHLDDEEDGDLLHVEVETETSKEELDTLTFAWVTGYNQYVRSD